MAAQVSEAASGSLGDRLTEVRSRIADAATSASRDAAELTLIVVTKFHPPTLVRELAALGVTDFGENRHQEAVEKAADVADLGARWHFVGQLQSNKARAALEYVHAIHSVDRVSLVSALERADAAPRECFVQLNLTDDPARGGVAPDGLEPLVERILQTDRLVLRGVMAVAPLDEEPRRAFARVREASERVRSLAPDATAISAGMSHDFADAILEGATHLRIGSAITGNRPPTR